MSYYVEYEFVKKNINVQRTKMQNMTIISMLDYGCPTEHQTSKRKMLE